VADQNLVRRRFLKLAGGSSAAALLNAACAAPQQSAPGAIAPTTHHLPPPSASAVAPAAPALWEVAVPLTLNATEYAFIGAAVDTLIPADDLTPSGSDCGVAVFIDRQLAGAFGSGARVYRNGPFVKGKPEHGYQLPFTARELFRAGIAATNEWTQRTHAKPFDALLEADRAATLKALELGQAPLPGSLSSDFFEALLSLTMEGFFSDPIYGGNRGKVSWKMVGYPGLPATYRVELEAQPQQRLVREPQSIADFS
jgi:gluconate 2-dehydrogenase gamma chain